MGWINTGLRLLVLSLDLGGWQRVSGSNRILCARRVQVVGSWQILRLELAVVETLGLAHLIDGAVHLRIDLGPRDLRLLLLDLEVLNSH